MPRPATDDELLSKLKRHRRNILLLLFRHGELRTREIRTEVGFPRGSKEHHLGLLDEWELIEEVGRVNECGGIPERVFGLTGEGRKFVEEHLTDDEERPDSYELRVERLESEVGDLQDDVDRLNDKFETLLDRLENKLS